jgi:dephospho-CoA kinase
VKLVGLTGGIGSGKSTVSSLLAARGAVIVDADRVARDLQNPGQPVFVAMVERWGDRIVNDDGTLNRAEVATIAFGDPKELDALNGITHPAIQREVIRRIRLSAGTDDVVVLDNPLLIEMGPERYKVQAVLVVDVPEEVAVERLMRHRGFTAEDAWARIGAQLGRHERTAVADVVIDNSGEESALLGEVDRAWAFARDLPDVTELPEQA